MRKSPQELIQEKTTLLARLQADFERVNRPSISKTLRDSLYTKMVETEAQIKMLQGSLTKSKRRRRANAVSEAL